MSAFDTFWALWPRKVAKKAAEKAWNAAIKRVPAETIMRAAAVYAHSRHDQDQRFTVHAATWLNGDRWEDEAKEARNMAESAEDRRRRIWRVRLSGYSPKGYWPSSGIWGPRPGEPGFEGPKDLERQALADGQTVASVHEGPTTGFGDRATVAQGLKP